MSSNHRKRKHKRVCDEERRYTVRGIRRNPVDMRKFSKALLGLAMAEAERQAQAEHAAHTSKATEPEVTGQPPKNGDGHADQS